MTGILRGGVTFTRGHPSLLTLSLFKLNPTVTQQIHLYATLTHICTNSATFFNLGGQVVVELLGGNAELQSILIHSFATSNWSINSHCTLSCLPLHRLPSPLCVYLS